MIEFVHTNITENKHMKKKLSVVTVYICLTVQCGLFCAFTPYADAHGVKTLPKNFENAPVSNVAAKESAAELFDTATETSTLPVSAETSETTDENENTTETPTPLPKGDADGNGEVTVSDARILLRCAIGLESIPEEKLVLWDFNENGVIDVADARAVLRIAIGLPPFGESNTTTINPEEPTQRKYAELLADKIVEENLDASMKMLCNDIGRRYVGSSGEPKARSAICNILKNYGFEPYFQNVSVGNKKMPSKNIIVKITTAAANPDIYLFSAHYDCSNASVGAVDNASGVSALLELARVLKNMNCDFGCEIRFALFAGEENGYYGAYKYRSLMTESEKSRHRIFFNVDMAGHSTDENKNYLCVSTEPVTVYYSKTKKEAYDNIGSNAVRSALEILGSCGEDGFFAPVSAGQHDIVPFRKADLPSLTLSWREISTARGAGNDHNLASPAVIHTRADNLSNFDSKSLYYTTRLIASSFAIMTYNHTY